MERNMDELRTELMPAGSEAGQALTAQQQSAMGVEEQRAIAQVQGAMTVAKRFPRDPAQALARVMRTCDIGAVAEDAEYSFPRGGKTVRGPSIRLAEAVAKEWGNIDYGVVELSRGDGESVAMTYAWDLETNVRSVRQFVVPHRRDKAEGAKDLDSDRDIYEHVANQGSRRLRACMLQVIPTYVIDAAVERSRKTLERGLAKIPMGERMDNMIKAFGEMGVTTAQIVGWLKHPLEDIIEKEFIELRNVYKTIKDGMGRVEDYFEKAKIADTVAAKKGAAAKPAAADAAAPVAGPDSAAAGAGVAGGAPVRAADGSAEPAGSNAPAEAAEPAAATPPAAAQNVAAAAERADGGGAASDEKVDPDDLVIAAQKAATPEAVQEVRRTLQGLMDTNMIEPDGAARVKKACVDRAKALVKASQAAAAKGVE